MQYVVDLSTGKKIEAPEEYSSNLYVPGEGIGPDHIEALRAAGESEEVLETLQSVGAPSSYQASPDSEIIPADDPRFPWDLLESQIPNVRAAASGGETIRTANDKITNPPNVFTDGWWPFCNNGNPAGVSWNPPTSNNYGGQYYVKGNYGNVYLWWCGAWQPATRSKPSRTWLCPRYQWHEWDPSWTQAKGAKKGWPKYKCR